MRNQRAHVISEVEFLAGHRDPESIAQALGYRSAKNLATCLYRWGRNDLATRIGARHLAVVA